MAERGESSGCLQLKKTDGSEIIQVDKWTSTWGYPHYIDALNGYHYYVPLATQEELNAGNGETEGGIDSIFTTKIAFTNGQEPARYPVRINQAFRYVKSPQSTSINLQRRFNDGGNRLVKVIHTGGMWSGIWKSDNNDFNISVSGTIVHVYISTYISTGTFTAHGSGTFWGDYRPSNRRHSDLTPTWGISGDRQGLDSYGDCSVSYDYGESTVSGPLHALIPGINVIWPWTATFPILVPSIYWGCGKWTHRVRSLVPWYNYADGIFTGSYGSMTFTVYYYDEYGNWTSASRSDSNNRFRWYSAANNLAEALTCIGGGRLEAPVSADVPYTAIVASWDKSFENIQGNGTIRWRPWVS